MSFRRRVLEQFAKFLLLAVLIVLTLLPVYWMFLASLRTNDQITVIPPRILPGGPTTLENYARILADSDLIRYYGNSVFVAVTTVIICLLISIFAGYAFSRFRFFGRNIAMTGILSVQMFPLVAILISLFGFFRQMNLTNSLYGLVLAHLTMSLPFSIWFLKSFFDSIPIELEEAAYIDGAGRLRTLFQIVVPLTRPGLIAVAIYAFLLSWDDFLFGLTLVSDDAVRTLPVGIANKFLGEFEYDWSGMMTVSIIASLPILILFVALNRYMVEGLTAGAVKG